MDIMKHEKVPAAAITVVPGTAHSTYAEARYVRRTVTAHRWRSLPIVTSPWHTRRSRLVFREAFAGSDVQLSVQAVPGADLDRWWTSAKGRDTVASEYLKLLAHVLGVR